MMSERDIKTGDSETESHEKLHKSFYDLIDRMIKSKCPLPDFKLYYMTMYHLDRKGGIIKVKPFLTEDEAKLECSEDEKWEGKYGSKVVYSVVDSNNYVSTENYSTEDNVGTEIDIKIPEY